MNFGMVRGTLFKLIGVEGALMMIPTLVSLYFGEATWTAFFIPGVCLMAGGFAVGAKKPASSRVYAKESLFITGMAWILLSVFGAIPYVASGAIPNYEDAFFETVSGFTTTGATLVPSVELLPKGVLFWRSFTQWIGGMGVLVFIMAIVPLARNRSMYLINAEMTGPQRSKLVPKTANMAKILYGIYIALTGSLIIILVCSGMPKFDAVLNAFATAGTGGFSIRDAGIAAYQSPLIEVVIGVYMILFATNFNIFFLLVARKVAKALKSEELWTYLAVVGVAVVLVAVSTSNLYVGLGDTVREAFFAVSSTISTTGFVSANYDTWPNMAQTILFLLMFVGGCAGSTSGGLKFSRLIIIAKCIRQDVMKMLHPQLVSTVRLNNRLLDDSVISGVKAYVLFYVAILFVSTFVVAFNGFDVTTTVTSVTACLNNAGRGIGSIVGATGNFASFSLVSKVVLSLDMLVGRLEIFPIVMLFVPALWKRRSI